MDKVLLRKLGIQEITKTKCSTRAYSDVSIYLPFEQTNTNAAANISITADLCEMAFGKLENGICFGLAEKVNRLYMWPAENKTEGFAIQKKQSDKRWYTSARILYKTLKPYFTDTCKKEYELKFSDETGMYYINLKESN